LNQDQGIDHERTIAATLSEVKVRPMTSDSPFTISLSGPLFPSLTLWVEVSTKGNFAHTINRPQPAELLEFAFIAGCYENARFPQNCIYC